jgi:hypothetical protein
VAKLIVEQGPLAGKVFEILKPAAFLIGRGQGAQVDLPDHLVSRRHCQIEVAGECFFARDLGSANGTFVNGQRIACAALADGDRLRAGSSVLRFSGHARVDQLLAREIGGYRVEALIGRGGMGSVYRAEQRSLGRTVALKVLAPELARVPEFVALFLREARAAAALAHPHIVKIYEAGSAGATHFFSMEFVRGGTVEEKLASCGALPVAEALRIARAACDGLAYAESKKVVHRDIKPGNLLLEPDGAVKICDLGIAGRIDVKEEEPFRGGGSPHYIAPEQALGRPVDSRADIYSLGVSLYTMLSGHTPFTGASSREIAKKHVTEPPPPLAAQGAGIPPGVCELVAWMMAKDPADRPASAVIVRDRLDELLRGLSARPHRRPFPLWLPASLGAAAVLAALAVGVYLARQWYAHTRAAAFAARVAALRAGAEELLREARYPEAAALLEAFARDNAGADGLAWIPQKVEEVRRSETAHAARIRGAEARRALEELMARDASDGDFQEFLRRYGDTGAAAGAARELKAREDRRRASAQWETQAQAEFDGLKRRSDAYLGEGNFRLAIEAWASFPARFAGSSAAGLIAGETARIEALARARLDAILAEADAAADTGHETGALRIIAAYAFPRAFDETIASARARLVQRAAAVRAAASHAARAADGAAVAEAGGAIAAFLAAADFKGAVERLKRLRDTVAADDLRTAVARRIDAVEAGQRFFRRLCLEQDPPPRPLELAPGATVAVIRIRESSFDYYDEPGERRAKRMTWRELGPVRFTALLRAAAADEDERAACDALARELGVSPGGPAPGDL